MTLLTVISSRYYGGEGPLSPCFEFFITINTVGDLFLKRGLEIEDLCLYNKIYY